jgi:uridine kinase
MPTPSWTPLGLHKTLLDLEAIAKLDAFTALPTRDVSSLTELLDVASLEAGDELLTANEPAPGVLFLFRGALVDGAGLAPFPFARPWPVEALLGEVISPCTVRAQVPSRVALLRRARFDVFADSHPASSLAFLRRLFADRAKLRAAYRDEHGAELLLHALPQTVDGALVVAGRARGATRALLDVVPAGADPKPVTVHDWEGREIYRRSAALACLEAARRAGETAARMGPSWTSGRMILGLSPTDDRSAQARAIQAELDRVVEEDLAFEAFSVQRDEALRLLDGSEAGILVSTMSSPSIALNRAGGTLVLSPGPMLPHSGYLEGLTVAPYAETLGLDFGRRVRDALPKRAMSTGFLEQRSPRYRDDESSSHRWLEKLGVTSVGAFNRACITGEIRDVIDVAEGFHEKRIAELADEIRSRDGLRIIAVAGPSSSGKTTFKKRLSIQLRVVGLRPVELSLDDYYVDREKTVRDAAGEYDFEALEALDLELLSRHLAALLEGETVLTARYDFVSGRSAPAGGEALRLGPGDILLIEGIHALAPQLSAGLPASSVMRVFIHPATSLPFDSLTSLEPADVRLLRRIVRDRRSRGTTPAQNLARWPSVRRGERLHIDPHRPFADFVFDTSLVYEVSVLRVFAERYLLEVREDSPEHPGAQRLLRWMAPFVPIYPDRVPPTSILREFIGGSGFSY